MKVIYLYDDNHLRTGREYNVFAIQEWKDGVEKYYISEHDESNRYVITPFDSQAFEIIDTKISKFWCYGLDVFGKKTIGISEIINIEYFWNKYYDDDLDVKKILQIYYKIGKDELFNAN